MKHSFVDRYAALDSPIHILEARTKLIGFVSLIIAVLFVPAEREFTFFAYFFLTAALMGISQIPLGFIVSRAVMMLPFVLLAGVGFLWRDPADAAGIYTLFLRSSLCLILLILLTNTTRFSELLHGLRKLRCPPILVLNLAFLYRYLFVITEEVMRMRQARECRRTGRAPVVEELRVLGSMLGAVLLRSFERAERMYQAMHSRGFSGGFPVLAPRRFSWRDLTFVAVIALFIVLSFSDINISRLTL